MEDFAETSKSESQPAWPGTKAKEEHTIFFLALQVTYVVPKEPLCGGCEPVVHGDADVASGDGLHHVGDQGSHEDVLRPLAVRSILNKYFFPLANSICIRKRLCESLVVVVRGIQGKQESRIFPATLKGHATCYNF